MLATLLFFAQLVSGSQIPHVGANQGNLEKGFNIFYGVIGAVTVLILVIAGLRYIVKSDDANSISETKRMIAYTLVGLVVIVVAGTIVEYVLKAL